MDHGLYTIILDFRGGTYVSQVTAGNEREAMRRWASLFAEKRPAGRPSDRLAKAFLNSLDDKVAIVPLDGRIGAWRATAVCGDSLAISNIVGPTYEGPRAREGEVIIVGKLGDDVLADIRAARYDTAPR